jgi:hypothetical protein
VASTTDKRPFWMHQVVEYILGAVLVAQGLQSLEPVAPSIAGALIMFNAACVRGPLSAFRLVSRTLHRWLDVAVIAIVLALGVQPWLDVESGARLVMLAIAGVMAFVWWKSSFVDKTPRQTSIDASQGRSAEIGRLAGRAVGDGINAAKRLKKPSR